jgi:hypothetical protein
VSDRYKSREDVASKIEWEGGIFEALDYGIKTEHMPKGDNELTEAWRDLSVAYASAAVLANKVQALLDAEVETGQATVGRETTP